MTLSSESNICFLIYSIKKSNPFKRRVYLDGFIPFYHLAFIPFPLAFGQQYFSFVAALFKGTHPHRKHKILSQYNEALKIMAEKADITKNMTSYFARHSFAMCPREKGISIDVNGETLGHQSVPNTQAYLREFGVEVGCSTAGQTTGS